MITSTRAEDIPAIDRSEAMTIAATENERLLDLLRTLHADDWSKPTDCDLWDVRDMAGHLLGAFEGFSSLGRFVRLMAAAQRAKGDGPLVDGMTSWQVKTNAGLTVPELLDRMTTVSPANLRGRSKKLRVLRPMPMKQSVGGVVETWKGAYLLDVILTRDAWMHRVDIARAVGRDLVLTADHDGRIVADVVAEWARRHGQPFRLRLEGPAGGTYQSGDDGEQIALDAVEFCRVLSGRAQGDGLLAEEVPF